MSYYQEITNYSRNGSLDDVLWNLANFPVLEEFRKLFEAFSYCPWIFSLIGSILVGLSGVFPLLVIPIEEGENLKFGDGANRLRVLLSFAVGGLLADVFLHLLPEVWELKSYHQSHPSVFSGVWVLTGMLVFVTVEKLSSSLESDEKVSFSPVQCDKDKQFLKSVSSVCLNNNLSPKTKVPETREHYHISGYLNLMANSVDNFTHGLTIGGSFAISFKMGVLSTFAILVHELPHEVGDFAILLKSGFSRWEAAKAQLCTAAAGIMGSMVAVLFGSVESKTSWILPFTAGGFLHIALVTVLPDLVHEESKFESCKQLGSLVFGIAVMAFVVTYFDNVLTLDGKSGLKERARKSPEGNQNNHPERQVTKE